MEMIVNQTPGWDEKYNIILPARWIDPSEIIYPSDPPAGVYPLSRYYRGVVENYVDWMQQGHRSLAHLSWGRGLNFIYRPLNPDVCEKEEKNPTTYFVYESLYTFFAGIVTGSIPPVEGIDPDLASNLRRRIITSTAEIMRYISELGTGAISFDQKHDADNSTYRLLPPVHRTNRRSYLDIATIMGRQNSLLTVDFVPRTGSLGLAFDDMNNMRFVPAEIDGKRTSNLAELRLDRSRVSLQERRLMIDVEVDDLVWVERDNGLLLPKPGNPSLIHKYLGENVHHISLASLMGSETKQHDIDLITQDVMIELGLSSMLDMARDEIHKSNKLLLQV